MIPEQKINLLHEFAEKSKFRERGAVFLDLDGTALHEREGHVYIPEPIRDGVKAVHALGRPVVINSLRFPLSVIRTIGREWHEINCVPIPAVLLNGSMIGHVSAGQGNELSFNELQAFPLLPEEITTVLDGIEKFLVAGLTDIALFYYPRDWKFGEVIWTPDTNQIAELEASYPSCSAVVSIGLDKLREEMIRLETCMIFVQINAGHDHLMAYQHTNKHSYYTHQGSSKSTGAKALATKLNLSLVDSVGAGDTELDNFLSDMGLAIRIKREHLPYTGVIGTAHLSNSYELGEYLLEFCKVMEQRAAMQAGGR